MKLQTAFAKDIQRPINGVIKADQSDQAYNELDEYVITKEVDKHLRKFVDAYLSGIARSNDPSVAAQMAVWVSGFFGSGKSHLIKILSYLLANNPVSDGKDEKAPLDFFLEKIAGDAAFAGDLRKLAAAKTEVILFNIDSKAEQNHNRDPILRVFLRVFNEHCGYSGDHPEVAHMERFLDEKGKYEAFKQALQIEHGLNWIEERDSYHFHTAEIAAAYIRDRFDERLRQLNEWAALAGTGAYPGSAEIADILGVTGKVLAHKDSFSLINQLQAERADLIAQDEQFQQLSTFFTQQRTQWDALRRAYRERFLPNAFHLRKDPEAAAALDTIDAILKAVSPYARIKESGALIDVLGARNEVVLGERRAEALAQVDPRIAAVKADLADIGVDADFSNQCLLPLQNIRREIGAEVLTGQIADLVKAAVEAEDTARLRIEIAVSSARAKAVVRPESGAPADKSPYPSAQEAHAPEYVAPTRIATPEKFRQRQQVTARTLMGAKAYLESKDDVEAYLAALRIKLEEALAANARIEIL
jgi:hypothetical protein